jgi:hypothetical protein
MRLACIEPDKAGFDLRTFECASAISAEPSSLSFRLLQVPFDCATEGAKLDPWNFRFETIPGHVSYVPPIFGTNLVGQADMMIIESDHMHTFRGETDGCRHTAITASPFAVDAGC